MFMFTNLLAKKLDVPYKPPKKTYEILVCIEGFGHSGSGAILDLLSEFEETTVLGHHDKSGGSDLHFTSKNIEVDFLRRYGGVFDLSYAFLTKNQNIRDFKLKNFITYSEFLFKTGGVYNNEYMRLTNAFIEELIDFKIQTKTGMEGNLAFRSKKIFGKDYANLQSPFLYSKNKPRYLYYLKDISFDDYVKLASKYIKNILNTIESNKFLCIDQIISNQNDTDALNTKYLGKYKQISVHRDPRDVYITGILNNEKWIPQDISTFIKWYKSRNNHSTHNPNKLSIQFENLVFNYDKSLTLIQNFLGLKYHIYKKRYFKPNISKQNIHLWKKHENIKGIETIKKNLATHCYKI